ncbi:MAG: sulfatase-like hydrolase/transferase [Thermoanaerobaculia bacterium]|nr:sulfatase-like hydrolase/transferase [Thermoanaerobaculia bacterium]
MTRWRCIVLAALGLAGVACGRGEPPLNLVVVTFDTTRADRFGCYGRENAGTPNVDALAAQGFLFEHAVSAAPITMPAHATIFTGRYPVAHGVRDNGLFRLPDGETTLAERLRDRGYATSAAVGSFPLTREFGIDQGFDVFDDHITINVEDMWGRRTEPKRGVYFDERTSAQVNDAILPWLRDNADRPFFAWLHYWDPHQPLIPPPPFNQLYLHDLYQGEIAFADHNLGAVLRVLEEEGVYDRTLVVVVADHGEGLGEHQEESHSMLAYDTTLRVPMILRVPGLEGGHRLSNRVGTVDLLPTLMDLLDLEFDPEVQGRSLAGWIRSPSETLAARMPHYAETLSPRLSHGWGELRALYEGSWKYIHGPRPELYDLASDPDELTNVIDEHSDEVVLLRRRLEAFLATRSSDTSSHAVQETDPETYQRLAALGYISSSGTSPHTIEESLVDGGIAPQDRVRDISLMSQAKQQLDRGEFVHARELSRRLIDLDPGNAFYRGLLATALLGLGQIDEAARVVEDAASLASQNHTAFLGVATSLFNFGEDQRAIDLARRINSEYDSAYGRYLLGEMLAALGQSEEALAELDAALQIDPRFRRALLGRGIHLAQAGRYDEAETTFQELLSNHPLSERGHFNYAVMLLETRRWDLALEHLDRAIDLEPAYWSAHLARLALFADQGQTQEASAVLLHLEQNCPDPRIVARARALADSGGRS